MPPSPLPETTEVLVTSEGGDVLAPHPPVLFREGTSQSTSGPRIAIDPADRKQRLRGIGTSFTEASAFVLAHLDPADRRALMARIWGADGADFALARTPIGSTDFSVEGLYSYAEVPGDTALARFSIDVDRDGFSQVRHPGIRDPAFDLLPMIQEALTIKARQDEPDLRIVASAWSAPPWMKDVEAYHVPGAPETDWQGTGGTLKPEHEATYAAYLARYLTAYAEAGVPIWGLTPVNEPHGNSGQWESMHFTPETQRAFIADHLGPALHAAGHGDVRVLIFDQNRPDLEAWADAILGDPAAARYVYGSAVHWYASTVEVYGDVLARVRERHPGFAILHTEGCIDALGTPAGPGIRDPERFTESGWFGNDAFWWTTSATDWAYSATWAPDVEAHPIYTPVHRYARDVLGCIANGVEGWIDWNVVLDARGGPNHVGNFCGAPILIDTATGEVYETPVFHVLRQLSRTIRPGDTAVGTAIDRGALPADALHTCASVSPTGLLSVQVLNTTRAPLAYRLQVGGAEAAVAVPANALQTVRVQL